MGAVLVVDDQPMNRVIISKLLRSLNLEVLEACDGEQGLQTYLQLGKSIAFIFLDLMMPVLDGFKAALSIRSAENQHGWLPVPIVAFTSEDVRHGSPMWQQCMSSGFNDVVHKPMDKRHTLELLLRFLPGLKEPQAYCSDESCNTDGPARQPCSRSNAGQGKDSQSSGHQVVVIRHSNAAPALPSSSDGSSSGSGSDVSAAAMHHGSSTCSPRRVLLLS